MQFQFDVMSGVPKLPPPASAVSGDVSALLRAILETQQEHLKHAQAVAVANDHGARWRALLARWKAEFPGLPATCKEVLPGLERSYGALIARLVEDLQELGDEALDNEFALQDFLDRYGVRLGQLGHILNLVSPLAESANRNEEASPQENQ